MILDSEKALLQGALQTALDAGADKARVTFCKSREELVATLNGEVDKVTNCNDRSLSFALFADGRFGTFSTNALDSKSLAGFINKAVETVKTIAPDPDRDLPDFDRCCHDALTGNELDIVDPEYDSVTPEMRVQSALEASVFAQGEGKGFKLISEEGEYSTSSYDTAIMDSNGLCCLHSECSFDYGVELTIETEGNKYSGYWWDSASRRSKIDPAACGRTALERALRRVGAEPAESGKYNMVVESEVASRLVTPLLRALNAGAIQQNSSFLTDSLGKKIFGEGVRLIDRPRIKGNACSKYFDGEGVAAHDSDIIMDGQVCRYFVNTYMSHKLKMEPTIEAPVRPVLLPYPRAGLKLDDILGLCGSGILVTDFNGGNCNPVTGDFSYGVEGLLFENGNIVRPVGGMVVTGNFISLWNRLIAAGEDARECMSKLIPTLAFSNVDFSG